MLAEVEKEVAAAGSGAPGQSAAARSDEEINRKLEQTLSGVFGPGTGTSAPRPRPAPAAPPLKRHDAGDDLDALISRTLSGLGSTARAAAPAAKAVPPSAAAAPAPPAPPIPPAAPAPPPPSPLVAARKAPVKSAADLDFSALEELARPRRKSEPAPAASAPAPTPLPAAPAPAAPPAPRSVAPAAPQRVDAPMATQRIPVVAEGQQPGERFGQYTLQEKIAAGGMAEVWKARMRGVEGFQKTVAIKKILPHLTDNSEFIGMFIDEAKLAAQLSHPNIIHIYDLGKIGRDYYIAMEYVEGKDLRSIMNAARKKGMALPLGLALLIASRLASALDYAHRKRDFEGRELGLVHRDVSPQNVLITFEGDIKLCDFGIAKAVSKASQTQMGALKGKLQYMSPEQAWGKAVDARSDIFSLGAILFEMLTGERLFPGDNEMSVLEAVRGGRTRTAREISSAVPPEVDDIVRKALALDPEDRFASAGEIQARLESVLYGLKPTPGPTDLSAYLHLLFKADDGAASEPAAAAAVRPASEPAPAPPPAAAMAPESAGEPPPAAPAAVAPVAPAAGAVLGEEGVRRGRSLLVAAIAAAVIVLALLSYFLMARPKRSGAPPPVPRGTPAGATVPQTSAAQPAALPAPQPAAPAAGATGGRTKVDVSGLVEQELAKREGELRKKLDEQQKKLEKEVAAAKAKQSGKPGLAGLAVTGKEEPKAQPALTTSGPAAPPPQPSEPPGAARPEAKETRAQEPAAPVPAPPPAPEPKPAPEPPAVRPGELVEPAPDVISPLLVSFSKPEYPALARRLRIEGVVVVSVLVDENGHVQDAKLSQSIKQNVGINEAALGAARSAVFKPASKGGVRVKTWTKLRIPFKP